MVCAAASAGRLGPALPFLIVLLDLRHHGEPELLPDTFAALRAFPRPPRRCLRGWGRFGCASRRRACAPAAPRPGCVTAAAAEGSAFGGAGLAREHGSMAL